jgi:putative DNA primase/helicase
VFADGKFQRYAPNDGVFVALDLAEVERATMTYDGIMIMAGKPRPLKMSKSFRNGAIGCAMSMIGRPDFFASAAPGFAFSNGFVTVSSTGVNLTPHSAGNRATIKVDFPYDRRARRGRFMRFLRDVFAGDVDRGAKIQCLQEFIGACLLGIATRFQKAVVLLGEGANGKSLLVLLIEMLFPEEKRASIPPQMWGHEYHRAHLAGPHLNAVAELPTAAIIASTDFKGIVTGDMMTGRHPTKPTFNFRPVAGHLFSANELPATADQSRGFWRRFMLIKFNNTFAPPGDPTAPKDAKPAEDPDKLLAELEGELPGIFAWALDGAVRLMKQGKYTLPKSHEDELRAWRKNADPVAEFIQSACSKAALKNGTTSTVLFKHYERWARFSGHKDTLSHKAFAMQAKRLVSNGHGANGTIYALQCLDKDQWRDP